MARSTPAARTVRAGRKGAKASLRSKDFSFRSDADELLRRWEPVVIRRATRGARMFGNTIEALDFAQEARLEIAQISPTVIDPHPKYVQRVITNAMNQYARSEHRGLKLLSPGRAKWEGQKSGTEGDQRRALVRAWVSTLPPHLQELYRLVYESRADQRTIAGHLKVSQPRVSQLHGELVDRGRRELPLFMNFVAA
jgi:RNA polymerase sigma factor (sigma-70 family)